MNATEEALLLLPTDSSRTASNSNPNRPAFLLSSARQILSCYRRDDAADPEGFIASVAAILSEYPDGVVEMVSDPRTGIGRRSEFLPTIAAIAKDCDAIVKKLAEDEANERFQQRKRRTPKYIPAVISAPNLFVPEGFQGYDEMVARAKDENPQRYRFDVNHLCHDGVRRKGIWVQSSWWDHRGEKKKTASKSVGEIAADAGLLTQEKNG
jgi:hypothetical protein